MLEPRVISDASNLLVLLAPAPVVARVLELFAEARRLQVALWTAHVAERHPELRARAAARLSRWAV